VRSIQEIMKAEGLDPRGVVFAGGGTGLLIVPSDKAPSLVQRIEAEFAHGTGSGSCCAVWQAVAPHELIVGPDIPSPLPAEVSQGGIRQVQGQEQQPFPFGQVVRLLADKLREAKEEQIHAPFPPLPGYLHRCESCGLEAAALWDLKQGDRLCRICFAKRERGRFERTHLPQNLKTAQSLEEIAGIEAGERGYVAVLYADADNLGQTLFELQSMADYALFSQALAEIPDRVVRDLVSRYGLAERYQAPVLGGDDILLLLPAHKIMQLTGDLPDLIQGILAEQAQRIGDRVGNRLKEISFSVAFVIVPAHFAIRFAVDYAEELLQSAKKGRREKDEACVDFLVVKDASPLNLSVGALRDAKLERETARGTLRMTSKPLSLSKFTTMLQDVRLLREVGIAKSQLQQIERLLWEEEPSAIPLTLRYQWIKGEGWKKFFRERTGGGMRLHAAIDRWLTDGAFVQRGAVYETNLLDLLEIFEFWE
jgi:hypothetical protein